MPSISWRMMPYFAIFISSSSLAVTIGNTPFRHNAPPWFLVTRAYKFETQRQQTMILERVGEAEAIGQSNATDTPAVRTAGGLRRKKGAEAHRPPVITVVSTGGKGASKIRTRTRKPDADLSRPPYPTLSTPNSALNSRSIQ